MYLKMTLLSVTEVFWVFKELRATEGGCRCCRGAGGAVGQVYPGNATGKRGGESDRETWWYESGLIGLRAASSSGTTQPTKKKLGQAGVGRKKLMYPG